MASISDIAAALGTELGNAGVRAIPYLSDTFTPPVALVGIDRVDFHEAFGASAFALHHFLVYIIISRADDRSSLAALEGYMSVDGSTSIISALEANPTLGGLVSAVYVSRCGPPAAISINGAEYTSCPFEVQCYA